MKICFMCDLHLPFDETALQYDVLNWAIEDISKNVPDCIAFVGDITCDGNESSYDLFLKRINDLNIPFLYIPGNSDLRCLQARDSIKHKSSQCKNTIGKITVYAINDCDGTISSEQFSLLEEIDDSSIVFMHHPLKSHDYETVSRLFDWRSRHPQNPLFYGHLHYFAVDDSTISLTAMDPDKSIGEEPSVIYYDTETKAIFRSHYPVTMPVDISEFFGISCYDTVNHIHFAIHNRLKCLELRPNCVCVNSQELLSCVDAWRAAGGENLSVHLPDVGYSDGSVTFDTHYDEILEVVALLRADRVTQHVPNVSVKAVENDYNILVEIVQALSDRFNRISHAITIGIENMHMTANDSIDGNRRFGYIPEECLQFMNELQQCCNHKVGINFDIGHARNNAPYSQKYQISTWFSMIGAHIVGYHMHQVTNDSGVFENHMPFTHVYGPLISLGSFFKCWETGRINRCPIIFEMRPKDAYEISLKTFGFPAMDSGSVK